MAFKRTNDIRPFEARDKVNGTLKVLNMSNAKENRFISSHDQDNPKQFDWIEEHKKRYGAEPNLFDGA